MSASCLHHAEISAAAACAGCAEPFCEDCLVTVNGQTYCGSCKVMTVAGLPAPTAGTVACEEADQALRLAIFGVFCLGPILEPMALVKASQARRRIVQDSRLAGDGKVTAARTIAVAALALWGISVLSRLLVAVKSP